MLENKPPKNRHNKKGKKMKTKLQRIREKTVAAIVDLGTNVKADDLDEFSDHIWALAQTVRCAEFHSKHKRYPNINAKDKEEAMLAVWREEMIKAKQRQERK